jgi:hypothetical protein
MPDAPPSYFVCPILKEVMTDPHIAGDGFSYEAEAIREWLHCGHDTSPMTNLRLPTRAHAQPRALIHRPRLAPRTRPFSSLEPIFCSVCNALRHYNDTTALLYSNGTRILLLGSRTEEIHLFYTYNMCYKFRNGELTTWCKVH